MGAVVDLDRLLDQRRVWRGRQAQARPLGQQPTGHASLDERLPEGGWPAAALSELLLASPGCGELQLLWPSLARLTGEGGRVVLVGPPFIPYAPAWQAAGVDLRGVVQVQARQADALWAAEQCLRSGNCAAVLCWPERADDRALRRLQVAAEAGQALAFACRPQQAAHNPSPAALRIAIDARPPQWRVLKCRGGLPPVMPIACPQWR
ncbi:translesion DNA synthesis-associated protein ImuA [Pseudomonas guariconensis]|uniref:translesion DNA synthesis-associated protein ImuA n=1 Tax=Pseudomonas TaxID=286 RepID=UPI001CE3D9E5|nr:MULTISPECIES: translesion DNA synthesis-associated protein ImuA [Pseudomonas]MCO7516272.1 translesion DNA synthesis-associated protein ImuA [Pseudomonas putida]MCO7596232.1 translesion DNA synthesis-associated protein ImuA [Pseudomonas guariconensis]MCO7606280.1 translesion DNA synthesis-associated protein ImuA [Pseudomonas guariconensis]MCO7634281.1 translesion DNA synthesis-associated protein ImuA [Pseudomonas guariconensis]MCU7220312.1 translesion DNA synthesis-associated protein ImuA [P